MGILHTFRDLNYRGQGRTTLISHREVSLFCDSSAEYALSRCLRLVRIDHQAGDCGEISNQKPNTHQEQGETSHLVMLRNRGADGRANRLSLQRTFWLE
jgi:hypothetical protein